MGAWGTGPFENDDAADWAWELEATEDRTALLLETFAAATGEAPAGLPEASTAVAAAAWLASGLPGGDAVDVDWAEEPPHPTPPAVTDALRAAAVGALDAALAEGSEWREAWAEEDETAPIAAAERLRDRLRGDEDDERHDER